MLDISGLDKAKVLAVLYNCAAPHGMGFLRTEHAPAFMQTHHALHVIHERGDDGKQQFREMDVTVTLSRGLIFDYVYGRPLKCKLSGDEFNEKSYDGYHGAGAAEEAITELRRTGYVMNDRIFAAHSRRLLIEAERVLQSPEHFTELQREYGMGDFTERLVELTRRALGGKAN